MARSRCYSIDASSLLKLKTDFPKASFPALWQRIEELIREGRLCAADEVRVEIEADDDISDWIVQHAAMFKKIDGKQWLLAQEIANKYPQMAKPGKLGPAADPFVVALARAHNSARGESLFKDEEWECVVVTEETPGVEKIPTVCKAFHIDCIGLVQLIKNEGWVFN